MTSGGLLRTFQVLLFVGLIFLWYALTATGILPKFFFGEPVAVFRCIVDWGGVGRDFLSSRYHAA